jgi:Holliday junction resolvase RusA-like endonuclease
VILVIPGTLPSLNEMINASKRSKYVYVKMKNEAIRTVVYSSITKIPKLPPSDYIITWFVPNMRKDKDNIMAGQKFIFDGLQEAGKISNDGWKQIGSVTHRFQVDKLNPRVEIEIVEVSA